MIFTVEFVGINSTRLNNPLPVIPVVYIYPLPLKKVCED